MFASKYPVPLMMHILGVLVVIMTVLIVTSNPLAILGLFLMPEVPVLAPEQAEEQEPAIGFHADI